MKILSDRLALVLAEYSELPSSVQKVIDGNNKKDINMKGVLHLYKCGDKYLYVLPELFEKSELTSIYGNRIDRCNEDSFDTLLYYYFSWLNLPIDETSLATYVKGLETYTKSMCIEETWHILNLAIQCLENSYNSNFSAVLTFYALVEILVLTDKRNRGERSSIGKECSRKLPQFLKKDSITYLGLQPFINKDLSEKDIFDKLTHIRHKVIHGILKEAREILRELFPMRKGEYGGATEDAESSVFQDQLRCLNCLIRLVLVNILMEWMHDPNNLLQIKNRDYIETD